MVYHVDASESQNYQFEKAKLLKSTIDESGMKVTIPVSKETRLGKAYKALALKNTKSEIFNYGEIKSSVTDEQKLLMR